MKTAKNLILALCTFSILISCQKELSTETGGTFGGLAVGSLKDTMGNCLPIAVVGTYRVDSTLTDSNYVLVQVNITTPGNYKIISDTLNGFYFKDSGFISTTGVKTLKLKGSGKPTLAIQSIFTIGFGSGFCSFSVEAIASTGGGGPTNPTLPPGDYFPTTTGSNWTYSLNITSDTIRFTSVASNTLIGGVSYRNFVATEGTSSDTLYYRKASGLYYEYGNIDFLGVLDSVFNNIEFIFLKDNVGINSTWESSEVGAKANGVTGKAKLKFTILDKDINQTIGGFTVDSVIRVKREIMFQPTGGAYSSYSSANMSYSKKRGFLLMEGTLPPPFPPAPYRFEATRYEIKP